MEPHASTLLFLSYALDKPLAYFIPREFGMVDLREEDLEPEEQELLFHVRRLVNNAHCASELERLIRQVRALADFAEDQAALEFERQMQEYQDEENESPTS